MRLPVGMLAASRNIALMGFSNDDSSAAALILQPQALNTGTALIVLGGVTLVTADLIGFTGR